MSGWTQEHIDRLQREGKVRGVSSRKPAPSLPAPSNVKPRKYRNEPTIVDGQRFDSKLEALQYKALKLERLAGTVLLFTRQMRFDLPGGVIYRLDFFVVRPVLIGSAVSIVNEYIDCKGKLLQDSKNKIKQVESIYGIKIKLVRKGDV